MDSGRSTNDGCYAESGGYRGFRPCTGQLHGMDLVPHLYFDRAPRTLSGIPPTSS